jgi:hypothetical protein
LRSWRRRSWQPGAPGVAEGFLRIAVAGTAAAIKQVALERGRYAADFTL